ncbi:hypothetical protein KVP10_08630 [Candidimonas humi]|uniref:Uncharacterized protein n=1 Tax=Candidimonas humi TaxID=683355 RepID=A0ABV8NWK0_9BURK|nr:hypothetical protein [Candidimonas humi]MBV6304952.1 hypothetical protein [Candidimonas humi]
MANPILVSSGVTVTAASVVPAVEWVLSGCPHPVPESVSALVAGAIVALAHVGINWLNARAAKAGAPAAVPTPPAQ